MSDNADVRRIKAQIASLSGILREYEADVERAKTADDRRRARSDVQSTQNKIQGLKDELRHSYGIRM